MSPRKFLSVLIAAGLAWCAAAGVAQQNPQPQPGMPPVPPLPAEAKPFTAFPKLAPPPPDRPVHSERPPPDPALERLGKLAAAPVPADAPLLRKVQLARLREGYLYLARMRMRIEVGAFQSTEYVQYLEMQAAVYRLAADLAAAPADKVAWHEDAVRAGWEVERLTEARVRTGNDPPTALNLARFQRLAAEADLVRAMEAARPCP